MERIRMNIKRSMTWSLFAGVTACTAMAGCELLVDFDRSKIPTGADASLLEGGETPDATEPTDGAAEGSTMETGADATPSPDATTDGGDAGGDAGDAGTPDTGADAPSEAATVIDSGPDAVADAGIDGD
jgi:hypothetical protein